MATKDEIWIAYLDDDGKRIRGYFRRVTESINYIKIRSGGNILTIPFHRVLKIKESTNE